MDPYLGEIRIFAGNFAPQGWALCNGQTLPLAQNAALFAILGLNYGGDGKTTFGLPDFQGRAPMHFGNGTGLSPRSLGQKAGTTTAQISSSQLPPHSHSMNAIQGRGGGGSADQTSPTNNAFAVPTSNAIYVSPAQSPTPMSGSTIGQTGGNQAHNNMQPYLALSFIIALQGVFPQRP